MEYRFLGNSGLKVSCLGLGNWINVNNDTEKETMDCMARCFEHGINYFDTSEMYYAGAAEALWGRCLQKLKWKREDYVISTKLFKCVMNNQTPPINGVGLSRKHVIEGMNASLQRLQLDYVDVVYCHRYDHETSMEDICKGMNYLIEHGKAFYWGTSEWSSEQIMEAIATCEKYDLIMPIVDQALYNMFYRDRVEVEYANLYNKFKYGVSTYASLAGGILTGKYNDGTIPEDSRGAIELGANTKMFKELLFAPGAKEKTLTKTRALAELAKESGCSTSQLVLAWTLANKDVSTVIFGARNVSQVEDNVQALKMYQRWTPELDRKIEEIIQTRPSTQMNWKLWKPFEPRR